MHTEHFKNLIVLINMKGILWSYLFPGYNKNYFISHSVYSKVETQTFEVESAYILGELNVIIVMWLIKYDSKICLY